MQIFELHFNPKIKEGRFFDSFVYEPEHSSEKKLGSLYIVGELKNSLPSDNKFLDKLAQVIKKNYYRISYNSAEKALSEDLKTANHFLAEEVKKENVGWLGNLSFAVLSLKNFELNFTKTGDLKVLLIREGQISDIGKNLDLEDIEPYPLKVFFSVVSGKLTDNDIIIVLTKDVFNFFAQQNILNKIAGTKNLDKKKLKEILPANLFQKEGGAKISGVCLLAVIKKELKPKGTIIFRKDEKFSPKDFVWPIIPFFKKTKNKIVNWIKNIYKPARKQKKKEIKKNSFLDNLKGLPEKIIKAISFKKEKPIKEKKKEITKNKTEKESGLKTVFFFNFRLIKAILGKIPSFKEKKGRIILILILIFILIAGFLIFKKTEENKENKIKIPLEGIERKINLAEGFIILEDKEKASSLLKEAWLELMPLMEKESSFSSDINSLKETLEEKMKKINNLNFIENPEQVSNSNYQELFNPIVIPENLIPSADSEFNPDLSASYLSNLYFLDKKTCKVIKYSSLGKSSWSGPKLWKEGDKHCQKPKSMAIDGSIWILNKDNSLTQYFKGDYQKTINLDFFPFPEDITKIKTTTESYYFYLLEPVNKRIIITDKAGNIIKQFQSDKFDNLKDIVVSKNEKTIWVLNNNDIYKIEI